LCNKQQSSTEIAAYVQFKKNKTEQISYAHRRRIDCTRKIKSIITRRTDISHDEVVFAAIVFQSNYDWFNYIYKETNSGVDTCPRQIGFKPHDILIPQFVTGKQNNNKKKPTPIAYINFHYANPLYMACVCIMHISACVRACVCRVRVS